MDTLTLTNHQYIFSPGHSQSKHTLCLLHGTGGDEYSLLDIARMIDPAAAILSVRGTVDEAGHNRFFKRLAEGVYDLEDLQYRTDILAQFMRQAVHKHGLNNQDIILVGYSNGANIAINLLFHYPELARKYILWRPLFTHKVKFLPTLTQHRVLISAGEYDPLASMQQTEELSANLQEYGAEVALQYVPAGHQLTDVDIEQARQWLEMVHT